MTSATSAAYLYCVVRSAKRPSMARVPSGVPEGTPPDAVAVAPSLWMIVASVPLDIYGPAALEPRLRDLDWVSQAAVAHDAVVDRLSRARGATVIPMKLFTLFSTPDKAMRELASRRAGIQRAMRRIAGAEEWGVRVFRRRAAPADRRGTKPASGTDFLRGRQQARDAASGARAQAAAAADGAFGRLRRHARDARVRETRSEPGTNPPMLDAAFLVTTSSRARFRAEARRQARVLAAAGADLVLSGPWPAYNFVAGGERTAS